MNPHEIAALSSEQLSTYFRQALARQDVPLALDIFTQIETRFQSYVSGKEGSQQFINEFLALGGSTEVKALHLENLLQQCVVCLEYLLKLAGERARSQTSEETMLRIVESRERGRELIQVLGGAPSQGMIASELAAKLGITAANLSPLIRIFYVHGILDKRPMGKMVFLRLTPQGRAVLQRIKAVDQGALVMLPTSSIMPDEIPTGLQPLFGELMLKVARDVRDAQVVTDKAVANIIRHTLDNLAEQYYQQDRRISWLIATIANDFRKTLSELEGVA